jgi:predicted O-methyltransferase YrrM
MTTQTFNMTDEIYQYILNNSVREIAIQRKLREETAKMPNSNMQISPEQGQFMALLVELMGARKTLEIGVFTGYSALAVALALPADGRMVACDTSKEWTDVAQRFWREAGVANKIDLRIGSAVQTLDQLIVAGETNSFDFAFIDADKLNYDAYYERTLKLLKSGGLVAIDNVLQDGRVADPDSDDERAVAIRQLNAKIHKDSRVHISLVPMSDGITLARKL